MIGPRVFVGVMAVTLAIPGARSLKDRRQVVRALTDRLRHRFELSVHELPSDETPGRQVIVLTTAGNDPRLIRGILDKARGVIDLARGAQVQRVDLDVTRWHAPDDFQDAFGIDLEAEE